MDVVYKIGGADLRNYGVYVSKSEGLLSRPKLKAPHSVEWKDAHGEVVDLTKKYYESREIKLDCFIKADHFLDFETKANSFLSLFDSGNTKRLFVAVSAIDGIANLAKGTNTEFSTIGSKGYILTNNINTMSGRQLSISFDYEYSNVTTGATQQASRLGCEVLVNHGSGSSYFLNNWVNLATNSSGLYGSGRAKKTVTLPASITSSHLGIPFYIQVTSGNVKISKIKIELNSTCTDWYPAIEDLKPLLYEVYLSDTLDIKKEWNQNKMVGTFSIKLKEPEPIKRVLSLYEEDETLVITTSKPVNIYWGDGTCTTDVVGTNQSVSHAYDHIETWYIIITGDIDAITSLTTTNSAVVWTKL